MRMTLAALSLSAVLAGCASSNDPLYPDINVSDTAELLAADSEVVVLDIRTPAEYERGHIPGAVMIDCKAPDFADRLRELDPGKTYVMH